jgi:prepilin-type N-terminal cleavage/methylation domain-containing protein
MKGYTLVELMIVVGVITTLSIIALVGIRGAAEREELVAAGRQLVGDLVSAQNKASSGKDKAGFAVEKTSATSYRTVVYKYSYASCLAGEVLDCSGDYCDDCPSGETNCSYCRELVGEFSFASPQVTIDSPADFSVYFFRPPNIGRALLSLDPLRITLLHTGLGFEKTVVVRGTSPVQIYEE